MIESTIHAREWVTVSTATYLLNELLTSNDPTVQDLAKNFNWVIIPVLNVDGYVYTHKYVSSIDLLTHRAASRSNMTILFILFQNRMWRKTRRPSATLCFGVDANRNFDFHFAGTLQITMIKSTQ